MRHIISQPASRASTSLRQSPLLALVGGVACMLGACASTGTPAPTTLTPQQMREGVVASNIVIAPPAGTPRPPFAFSRDDEAFLEEVQRGAFNFLWDSCDPAKGFATGMVVDRTSKDVVSVAGVGFQLSALLVGVERGWITRAQGYDRALLILRTLEANPTNRQFGLFYHFINNVDAGQPDDAYEHVVSTIDSALLFAGMLTASQYFGGDVQRIADRLVEQADWSRFVLPPDAKDPQTRGFVTLGWRPDDKARPNGPGRLLDYAWVDNGDEHRLVTFLGVAAPRPEHRLDPALYYRMRRQLGQHTWTDPATGTTQSTGPMVWFPWSGALFASFFAHCWFDYSAMGADDPSAFGIPHRARVDWWENSRRTVLMHRWKSIENPKNLAGFGELGWGLTASDDVDGYAVPGLFPTNIPMLGAAPVRDFNALNGEPIAGKDDWGDGTLAPYGAGCAVMFDPRASVATLRHYRDLARTPRLSALWNDPSRGGYGFQDSFHPGTAWVAPDCVAIDQGPLILAIENARTGLIWTHFHAHPIVRQGMARLGLSRER